MPDDYSPLIKHVQPTITLSANIDTLFQQIAKPDIRYDFAVSLSLDDIGNLIKRIAPALRAENDAIAAGESKTPAVLLLEFKLIVERLLKEATR